MAGTVNPSIGAYGNSFATPHGDQVITATPKGEIISSGLNQVDLDADVELTNFEKQIKAFILARLGHPVVRVELTDFQLKIVIDEAVSKLHYHAPEWAKQYLTFTTVAGQNIYELPQYVLDNLRNVTYKKNLLGFPNLGGSLESDYFLKYFQSNLLFNDFSVGEYALLQMTLKTMRKVLGQDGTWEVVNNRYLQLYPAPTFTDTVIVEYYAIDSGTIHPAYKNFIQRYALALAKEILGQERGKYLNLPGPGGGARLNGDQLIKQSQMELENLNEELFNEFNTPPMFSMY